MFMINGVILLYRTLKFMQFVEIR